MSFCSYPTLCRFRSTSRHADQLVATEIEFRYSKVLRRFVTLTRQFRDMLNHTGSVLSGSFAVAVAGDHMFPPADLDIYTTEDGFPQVLSFLLEREQFTILLDGDPHIEDYAGGAKRLIRLLRDSICIDLVVSLTQSPTLPIAHFWSTPVMLFLTGDGICMPYPTSFEKGLGLFNPGRMPMDTELRDPLVNKYKARGFSICEREVDWYSGDDRPRRCAGPHSPTCPVNVRHFGDRLCLTTSLKTLDTRSITTAFSGPLANLTTVWWRGGSGCGGLCNIFGDSSFVAWTQTAEMVGM